MSTPTFNRVAEGVYLASGSGNGSPCMLWLPESQDSEEQISLASAWEQGAVAVLARVAESDVAGLMGHIPSLLAQPEYKGARFLWIENPATAWTAWRVQALILRPGDMLRYPTALALRNYAIHIPAYSKVGIGPAGWEFMSPETELPIRFSNGYGGQKLQSPVQNLALHAGGDASGCFTFSLALHLESRDELVHYPDLELLDQGLRLSYPDPDIPALNGKIAWLSQRYPVFMETSEEAKARGHYPHTLQWDSHWDLLAPLDTNRSFFRIKGLDGSGAEMTIPSGFRSTMGYHIHLKARDEASKMVFSEKPGGNPGATPHPLYLCPAGDFDISLPRYGIEESLPQVLSNDTFMAGISGIEVFLLETELANSLRFIPGHAAAIPGFTPAHNEAPARIEGGRQGFSDAFTTPWCYLFHPEQRGATYYSQPEGASLYTAREGLQKVLIHLPTPAAVLPQSSNEELKAFPMLPYGAVDASWLANYKRIEADLIAPVRQATILQMDDEQTMFLETQSAEDIEAASPQGIVVTMDGGFEEWKQVQLARGTEEEAYPQGLQFGFDHLQRDTGIRRAFHHNQLFLVITKPEALAEVFDLSELRIQGWTFDLDPAKWEERGTFFILKYRPGSMRDLVDNLSVWTEAEATNERPTSSQRKLANLLDEVIHLGTGEEPAAREKYATLARAVTLDAWTGVLGLNVHAPLDGLPDELLALGAGIDQSKFYAQYVGVEHTPVWVEDGKLESGPSALFGLLDYKNDQRPAADPSGYNFVVTRLSVRFAQSRVQDFAADIIITLDKLFEEDTLLLDSENGRNDLLLKGSAETHQGKTTYSFSFSGKNRFQTAASPAFARFDLLKATFVTDPLKGPKEDNPTIVGRFAFWGNMHLRALGVDVLGFGAEDMEAEADPHFLAFGNLQVEMRFPLESPSERTFHFVSDKLSFDRKASLPRPGSLPARFPMELKGLLFEASRSPASLGYLPVRANTGNGKPAQNWYGLDFSLELGTLGALVGGSAIVSHIILAWEPGGKGVYVGLRLPGANGLRSLKLQGILELTFKHIVLEMKEEDGEAPAYVLKLKNIVLKFFNIPLPPNTKTELSLFSNPDPNVTDKALGWYAAYKK